METQSVNLENDVYYNDQYTSLYLTKCDSLFEYEYNEGNKKINFRSIKRLISHVGEIKLKETLYDLLGHYGYGGPLTNDYSEDFLRRAFESYKLKCAKENIVCELFRFHPLNPLAKMDSLFHFHTNERQVVKVDLSLNTEDRRKLYSKTTRNILRKSQGKFIRRTNYIDIPQFQHLYFKTMDRNQAKDFYYFDQSYFTDLSSMPGVDLLSIHLGDELVSCGYFMHGDELAHYHLSANNPIFMRENGNYELLDFAFDHAKSKGCRCMMLGGGRTSEKDDKLFHFKRKFSPTTLPFYISGLNFLPEKKIDLNNIWESQNLGKNVWSFQHYRVNK